VYEFRSLTQGSAPACNDLGDLRICAMWSGSHGGLRVFAAQPSLRRPGSLVGRFGEIPDLGIEPPFSPPFPRAGPASSCFCSYSEKQKTRGHVRPSRDDKIGALVLGLSMQWLRRIAARNGKGSFPCMY